MRARHRERKQGFQGFPICGVRQHLSLRHVWVRHQDVVRDGELRKHMSHTCDEMRMSGSRAGASNTSSRQRDVERDEAVLRDNEWHIIAERTSDGYSKPEEEY